MNDRLCRRLSVAATAAFLLVGWAIFFLSHYRIDDDEVLLHYTSHHICDPAAATRMNDMLIDLMDKSRGATDERTFDKSSRKAAIRIAVEGNYPLPSLVYCLVAKAPVHGGDQDFLDGFIASRVYGTPLVYALTLAICLPLLLGVAALAGLRALLIGSLLSFLLLFFPYQSSVGTFLWSSPNASELLQNTILIWINPEAASSVFGWTPRSAALVLVVVGFVLYWSAAPRWAYFAMTVASAFHVGHSLYGWSTLALTDLVFGHLLSRPSRRGDALALAALPAWLLLDKVVPPPIGLSLGLLASAGTAMLAMQPSKAPLPEEREAQFRVLQSIVMLAAVWIILFFVIYAINKAVFAGRLHVSGVTAFGLGDASGRMATVFRPIMLTGAVWLTAGWLERADVVRRYATCRPILIGTLAVFVVAVAVYKPWQFTDVRLRVQEGALKLDRAIKASPATLPEPEEFYFAMSKSITTGRDLLTPLFQTVTRSRN